MKTYPKKRIEIIIEAPLSRRMTEQLDRAGVTGYSIIPLLGGKGLSGSWSSDGQIGRASGMIAIICITDAACFWFDDAWDGHGTGFQHLKVEPTDGQMQSLLIEGSGWMAIQDK